MQIFLISIFGIVGILSRYGLDKLVATPESGFPLSTFIINILGSAFAGCLFALAGKDLMSPALQIALIVGFCGGFTTFSAYALQTVLLFERSQVMPALLYFLLSPTLGFAAAFGALYLTRKF